MMARVINRHLKIVMENENVQLCKLQIDIMIKKKEAKQKDKNFYIIY